MVIKCVSKFSSSSGVFQVGDIISGPVVVQLLKESPDSFVQVEAIQPSMGIQDKALKSSKVARKAAD